MPTLVPVRIRVAFLGTLLVLLGQRRRAFWYSVRWWLRWVREHEQPTRCSCCLQATSFGNPALPTLHAVCRPCRTEFHVVALAA